MGKNKNIIYNGVDTEFFIDSLWILERSSGLCIFEENYVDFTKNGITSDLIASFLSALLSFAGETFTDEIQYIKFSNRKIFFHFSDYVLFVIAINNKNTDNIIQTEWIKKEIAERFKNKYQSVFKHDNWSNNISMFNGFSTILKNLVKKEPIKEKFVQSCISNKNCEFFERFLRKKTNISCKHKERLEKIFHTAIFK